MQAKINSTTISRYATAAVAADTRHTALCFSDAADKKIGAVLKTYRKAMLCLAATPADTIADIQRKGLALETATVGDSLAGDFGVARSLLRDLRQLAHPDS